MREQFKDIADVWHEATDASKHVFEVLFYTLRCCRNGVSKVLDEMQDISIATFLILLWKDMYPAPTLIDPDPKQPWRAWGHPPNGFLDLGCIFFACRAFFALG